MRFQTHIALTGDDPRADESALGQLYGMPPGMTANIHVTDHPPGCRVVGMLHDFTVNQQLRLVLAGTPSALRTWWVQLDARSGGIA